MEEFVTADLHLNHPKALSWRPQFSSVEEMNESIIEQYNARVGKNDLVHLLGDICLGHNQEAPGLIKRLNGRKRLIIGNHDTQAKIKNYLSQGVIEEAIWADRIKHNKVHMYFNHFPMLVGNFGESHLWCVHGHRHSKDPYAAAPNNIEIGIDTFDAPVALDEITSLILNFSI